MPPKTHTPDRRRRRQAREDGRRIAGTTAQSDPDKLTISRELLNRVIRQRVEEIKAKLQPRADLADALQDVLRDTVEKLDQTERDLAEAYREIDQLKRRGR